MNKLDPRNYRNPMAGHNPGGKAKNPLATLNKAMTKPANNKYGASVSRHGLAFRSLEDGANLIEKASKLKEQIDAATSE